MEKESNKENKSIEEIKLKEELEFYQDKLLELKLMEKKREYERLINGDDIHKKVQDLSSENNKKEKEIEELKRKIDETKKNKLREDIKLTQLMDKIEEQEVINKKLKDKINTHKNKK